MDLLPLFPTAIASFSNFITEDERVELFENIKKINHHKHGFLEGKSFSFHWERGRDGVPPQINVLNNIIRERVQNSVDEYVKEYGILSCKVTNIWSNIQHSGSVLEEHYHPISIISGALYVNIDDSCSITFHNPNPHIYYTPINQRNSLNFEWQKCKIVNGDLILFPSWLKHGNHKEVNQMNDRMVISFNTHYG